MDHTDTACLFLLLLHLFYLTKYKFLIKKQEIKFQNALRNSYITNVVDIQILYKMNS